VTETIDGGETRTVSSGLTETITGGETRDVTGGLNETITGGEDRTVNGDQTKTITGSKNETVLGGMTVTTPAVYDLTAVGGVNITAPGGVKVIAPGGYTLVAPAGQSTVDSFFTSIGGKNEDFFSIVNQATGMKNEVVGMANTGASAKIDMSGFVLERTYAKNDNEPIGLKEGGINLAKGTMQMLTYTCIMLG
jgi:type VI secretion system secreted protein VgrG